MASSYRKDLHYVASGIKNKSRCNCRAFLRTFSNSQVLGRHRASSKWNKVLFFSEALATTELNIQNHGSRLYRCSFCGNIFASGQAFGGHMRLHLVAAEKAASAPAEAVQASAAVIGNMEQISSDFGTLDLNLHATEDENYGDHDEMIEDSI